MHHAHAHASLPCHVHVDANVRNQKFYKLLNTIFCRDMHQKKDKVVPISDPNASWHAPGACTIAPQMQVGAVRLKPVLLSADQNEKFFFFLERALPRGLVKWCRAGHHTSRGDHMKDENSWWLRRKSVPKK